MGDNASQASTGGTMVLDIVVRTGAGERDCTLRVARGDATIGDLVGALARQARALALHRLAVDGVTVDVVTVDGVTVSPHMRLADAAIVRGSVVEFGAGRPGTAADDRGRRGRSGTASPGFDVAVVGGLAAGPRTPVGDGSVIVGRGPHAPVQLADPTVSPVHLRLGVDQRGDVEVVDLGSFNGSRLEGRPLDGSATTVPERLIEVGASQIVVRRPTDDDRPVGLHARQADAGGRIPFNRPPRTIATPVVEAVPVPDPPADRHRRVGFSVVALIGPIAMGVLMVQLLGNIRYALFALMAPVLMITNALAARRRNAKDHKSSKRRFRADLERFRTQLDGLDETERTVRERAHPDPSELLRRAMLPSSRLWERRPNHADYLALAIGRGPHPWEPPVDRMRCRAHPDLEAALRDHSAVDRCPIAARLGDGGVIGLVGHRGAALAVARSLVMQAAVLHGPADLAIAVLSDEGHGGEWDWVKWLPHVEAAGGGRLLAGRPHLADTLMAQFLEAHSAGSAPRSGMRANERDPARLLVVVDDEELLIGHRAPTRQVLAGHAGPVAGIVIAHSAERLPSACTDVVELLDDLGDARIRRPHRGETIDDVVATGVSADTARSAALALARYDDPERADGSLRLPTSVRLLALLGMDAPSARAMARRWADAPVDPPLCVPIGVGTDGPVTVDLVADGPHALVGGTTGSGKSELLRSLVVGLAAALSPTDVTFVLIDYKGASAFARCADLPHTVGMVTDLDGHLGERAIRSLHAELHHRERVLRDVGAADLSTYRRMGSPTGPMPRLVLVVDEFATLATELPDVMGAIVGVAQRGRSLGVHMVLATQRPAGVVNANIRANTDLRIALRVQSSHDSVDILDHRAASDISKATPGRAWLRRGSEEPVPVQTALASSGPIDAGPPVAAEPFRFGPTNLPGSVSSQGASDLDRLVDAATAAFRAHGGAPPRRPWLPMPSERVGLGDIAALARGETQEIPLALGDDPARQRHVAVGWRPGDGHLALFGSVGSGTTCAVLACVLSATRTWSPAEVQVYCLDMGGGALSVLDRLPHVGAVVVAGEDERLRRLVSMLRSEVERRRQLAPSDRVALAQWLVAVDGLPEVLRSYDGTEGHDVVHALKQVLAEGPNVGVAVAFTADRPAAVPARLSGPVARRWLLRPGDPADAAALGLRPAQLPEFVPGRAVDADDAMVLQVAWVDDVAAEVAAIGGRWSDHQGSLPPTVDPLPVEVRLGDLDVVAHDGPGLVVPVGLADLQREAVMVELAPGDHLTVVGPARSGVTSTLRMMARAVARLTPAMVCVAVADERSPLRGDTDVFDGIGTIDELERVLTVAAAGDGRDWLIVVDDVHLLEDGGLLADIARSPGRCHVIAGGRSDQLHGRFSHWTRSLRRSGVGVLLRPRLDADGDLFSVRLPRHVPVPMVAGRGFVVDRGVAVLVQVAAAGLDAGRAA